LKERRGQVFRGKDVVGGIGEEFGMREQGILVAGRGRVYCMSVVRRHYSALLHAKTGFRRAANTSMRSRVSGTSL